MPYLVNDTVPGKASVVDNDVNLAVAKFRSLLDQLIYVAVVQHIAGHRQRLAAILVDALRDLVRLVWRFISSQRSCSLLCSFSPLSISETITYAPSFANRRAHSAPMPWPDPVMIATWPGNIPLG